MHNLFDSKNEKLTEKAFSQSLLISVLSILLCIVALCSITYAWIVGESTSTGNTLLAGSFDLTISVTKDGDEFPVIADADRDGVWICNLAEEGTYTVNLKLKEESSVKGHCIVKVGDDDYKHTDAIFDTANADFIFTIKVTESTKVTFEPRWGVVVEPDIQQGEAITVKESLADSENTDVSE